MISLLSKPWPWYVSGPAIAGIMAVLLFFGKSFGFSRNLSNVCSMLGLGKHISYFNFNWRKQLWNIWFLVGSIIGGYIAVHYLAIARCPQIVFRDYCGPAEIEYTFRWPPGTGSHI